MGQIVGTKSNIFRCNLRAIQSGGSKANTILAADEVWLVDTTNSLTNSLSGNCDAYIVGDGSIAATALELKMVNPEIREVEAELKNKADIKKTTTSAGSFYITDGEGNVVLEVDGGYIKTEKFDSSDIHNDAQAKTAQNTDLSITDKNGNVVLEVVNGHVKTKNFDSSNITPEPAPELETLDDKVLTPSRIYELFPNSGFTAINRIYVEGLVNDFTLTTLRINGKMNQIASDASKSASTYNYNMSFDLTADGYESKTISVPVTRAKPENAKDKLIKIMCIGDSLTAGGYPSIVEYIFKRLDDVIGNINVLMVGHNVGNKEITYNGITKTCRGCHAGSSGYGISDFMRHFCLVRTSASSDSKRLISAAAAWDSLGLGTMTRNGVATRTYVGYTGSAEQKELMRSTCHGWYDADPTEDLWNYLYNSANVRTFTQDGTSYTLTSPYSSSQNDAIKAGIKWMCTNDGNAKYRIPFYDYATVQSSNGERAFDFAAYIAKYKTLADDGETRLVVGSTAGSVVTDADDYDVCTPNFVVLIMNHNDINQYGNIDGNLEDVETMADIINAYDNSINILLGCNRSYGSMAPEEYGNIGIVGKIGGIKDALMEFFTKLQASSGHGDFLNIYQTQSVVGAVYESVDTTTGNDAVLFDRFDNFTHTALHRFVDRAYQIVSWVISKL